MSTPANPDGGDKITTAIIIAILVFLLLAFLLTDCKSSYGLPGNQT